MPLLWHTDNTVIGKRKVKPITAKYFTQYLKCYRQLSRRMQIPDNLWRVQDVGFWADERHAAILAVHQQLSAEMFAQQVTSSFVIDSTVDAWYDPDSIAALQILHQCRHRLSIAAASSSKTKTSQSSSQQPFPNGTDMVQVTIMIVQGTGHRYTTSKVKRDSDLFEHHQIECIQVCVQLHPWAVNMALATFAAECQVK